jgi:hypothetical protein
MRFSLASRPALLRPSAIAVRGLLAALVLVPLAACSNSADPRAARGQSPLRTVARADCPHVGVLADAADLTRFRAGGGEDLTDMVMDAKVVGVAGSCDLARRATNVDLAVTIQATRGPASGTRVLDVPYFVAVTDRDGNVVDRASFSARFEFPANRTTARLVGEEIRLVLPTPEGMRGRDYAVTVGLQVDEKELAFNRRRGPR